MDEQAPDAEDRGRLAGPQDGIPEDRAPQALSLEGPVDGQSPQDGQIAQAGAAVLDSLIPGAPQS